MDHLVVGNSRPYKRNLDRLHKAWLEEDLVLCLGAGVSVPYGVPNWNDLVVDLLIREADPYQRHEDWSALYPNYRQAFVSWLTSQHNLKPEVLARLLKDRPHFLERIRERLYKSLDNPVTPPKEPNTLTALADLVKVSLDKGRPLRAVVTLNFDDLLEQKLTAAGVPCHAVYGPGRGKGEGLPVVHLHGFLPHTGDIPRQNLVFTEDEFHELTASPFHWAVNELVGHLRRHTVFFVGQSMADPNVRRLLDACRDREGKHFHYATRQDYPKLAGGEMDARVAELQRQAEKFGRQSGRSRRMEDDALRRAIENTLNFAHPFDREVLGKMGLKLVWFNDVNDVPDIIRLVSEGTDGVEVVP